MALALIAERYVLFGPVVWSGSWGWLGTSGQRRISELLALPGNVVLTWLSQVVSR